MLIQKNNSLSNRFLIKRKSDEVPAELDQRVSGVDDVFHDEHVLALEARQVIRLHLQVACRLRVVIRLEAHVMLKVRHILRRIRGVQMEFRKELANLREETARAFENADHVDLLTSVHVADVHLDGKKSHKFISTF